MIPEDDKDSASPVTVVRPIQRRRTRKLLRWTEHVLAGIGLCFLVYHLCFEVTVMTTDSMAPALLGTSYDNGDRILVEKVTRCFRAPRRWEIYFFYNEEGTPVAKRVVGLPGEKISIKDKRVCINGVPINLPARLKDRKYYPFGNLSAGREVDCGPGYYVLGDDSRDSYDSRFVGPIKKHQLRGRVWCILYPFSRFSFL